MGTFIQGTWSKLHKHPGRSHLKGWRATAQEGMVAGVLLSLKMGALESASEVWQWEGWLMWPQKCLSKLTSCKVCSCGGGPGSPSQEEARSSQAPCSEDARSPPCLRELPSGPWTPSVATVFMLQGEHKPTLGPGWIASLRASFFLMAWEGHISSWALLFSSP